MRLFKDHEMKLLRLIDNITNGTRVEISKTGDSVFFNAVSAAFSDFLLKNSEFRINAQKCRKSVIKEKEAHILINS